MFDSKLKQILDYIEERRKVHEPIYVKVMNAIDTDTKDVGNKPYSKNINSLESYFEFLKTTELKVKEECKGIMGKMMVNSDHYISDIQAFETTIFGELDQLTKCCKCKCISCDFPCDYKSCHMCESDLYVKGCDKQLGIVIKGQRTLMLYNNDERRDVEFNVKCFYYDFNSKKTYIYLVDRRNATNEHLLIYTKNIRGIESYDSIENQEELDKVYENILRLGV